MKTLELSASEAASWAHLVYLVLLLAAQGVGRVGGVLGAHVWPSHGCHEARVDAAGHAHELRALLQRRQCMSRLKACVQAEQQTHLSPLPPKMTLRPSEVVKVADGTTPVRRTRSTCGVCTLQQPPGMGGTHLRWCCLKGA